MKIIMNGITCGQFAHQAFEAVKRAEKDEIKEGRHNFKTYTFGLTNRTFSVCKNKESFTVYQQD